MIKFDIAVITVVYNNLSGITKTLNSVFKSKNNCNIQHIIVDGFSNDGTWEFLKKNKSKIEVLFQASPKGIYNAMNLGIEHINAPFHIFINSSDELFLKFKPSYATFIPVKLKRPWSKNYVQWKKPKKVMFNGNIYCHQGIIFPSKKIFYNENFRLAADYEYFIKYMDHFTNLKIQKNIGYSFYDTEGITSSLSSRKKVRKEEREIILQNFTIFHVLITEIYFNLSILYKYIINYYDE